MIDRLLAAIFVVVALILVLRFPRQVVRSVRRWGGDDPDATGLRATPTFDEVAARVRELIRPSLLLIATDEPVFSQLGGDPMLPAGWTWPAGERRPLSFLGQLDLAEAQSAGTMDWLPPGGLLYVFFDQDRHGAEDMVQVLYAADAATALQAAPKDAWRRFRARRVSFQPCRSAPSLEWLGLDAAELGLSDGEFAALGRIGDAPPSGDIQYRVGGYPNEIQPERLAISCEYQSRGLVEPRFGDPIPSEIEAAAEDWRLLLQIDSDPALGMNWRDGGRLYVFIRPQDARAADFTRTVTLEHFY